MKLKSYLEKQLQKALDHQDEHPVSGSANRAVKEAKQALMDYENLVTEHTRLHNRLMYVSDNAKNGMN
jgi:hypothetical protein